jgi:hypothetical protein
MAVIALSEMAVIHHDTFLPSSSSRRIEVAVSKTRTTCGRSFGVVILIQRASAPPLMPTRSRRGLAVCCGAAPISLVDRSAAKVLRFAMPRMIAAAPSGYSPSQPQAAQTYCRPGPSLPPLPALPAIATQSGRRGEPSAPGYSVRGQPHGNRPCFLAHQKLRQVGAVYQL